MFTLQDISSGELFQKVALALTPKDEPQDFIGDICLVYDQLMDLGAVQMLMLSFAHHNRAVHPLLEDCLDLTLNTLILLDARNSPHVICRPVLKRIFDQRAKQK